MKITPIETFLVDAGWRPWIFVKVETDEGVTGYGECSDGRNSLCAVLPNGRIMEIDVDDVPWREELVTNLPNIDQRHMQIPTGPGWGTDLNEEVARAHAWENKKANW